jgi:phosphoglycerate dehydrogenase-like enzyme
MPKIVKTDGGAVPITDTHRHLVAAAGLELVEVDSAATNAIAMRAPLKDVVALVVLKERIGSEPLDSLPSCRIVARLGSGLDGIDLDVARERGIAVTNAPFANTDEVATHALAMVLVLVRRLHRFDAAVRSGTWSYITTGAGMRRASATTVAVVGLGRIGSRVATQASALGFQVLAYDPVVTQAPAGVSRVTFADAVAEADVLTLHVPLTESTRGLIGREVLAAMRPGAMLVNVSRGGLVDEDALADALAEGRLSGAALDTFDAEPLPRQSRLWAAPGLIITPHAAHYSVESEREKLRVALEDVVRVIEGRPPHFPV